MNIIALGGTSVERGSPGLGAAAAHPRSTSLATFMGPVAVVLSLLGPVPSFSAQTYYYVDNSSASCSELGPGTEARPYCTISAAAAAHKGPGITIYVKPGVYRESVAVLDSGSAASPYEFKALGGPVILDGSDDFSFPSKWALFSGNVYLAASVTWSPNQVFMDGVRLAPSTDSPADLPMNSFTYVSGNGLYLNAGGLNPGTRELLVGRRPTAFYVWTGSHVTVDGFTIIRSDDRAIRLGSSSDFCTIRNNKISHSFKYGIYVPGCSDVLIEKNTVFDNGGHGIMITESSSHQSTRCTIQDNESFRNANPTIRLSVGILIYSSPGNLIRRNRLHDNQDSGLQIDVGSNNCLSIQNLSWNNGDHGFDQVRCRGVFHIGDVACNNFKDGFSIEDTAQYVSLYNCIAIDNGLTTNEFNLWMDEASSPGFRSDYNIFWNSTTQAPIKYIRTLYSTIAAYSAVSGQDTHSTQADPKFLSPLSGDFHVGAGSPAIDAADSGVPNWPATDADGSARQDDLLTPNTGVGPVAYGDRGALEFDPDDPPAAALIVTPSSGEAPLAVIADASGSRDADGNIVSYQFDFGDQTVVGPQAQPTSTHTYLQGNWTVTMIATDDLGLTGRALAPVTASRPNLPPEGSIDSPPSNVTIHTGQALNLTGTGTDPDGDTPLTYLWNLGGAATNQFAEDPGPVIFYTPGTYTISFTVTDALGKADPTPDTRSITVQPDPNNQSPTASLVLTPSTGNAPLAVMADASGSTDPDGLIVSYRFDFGDGTTPVSQTSPTATHTYAAGNWTAVVTVADNAGATASSSAPLTVAAVMVEPRFSPNPFRNSGTLSFTTTRAGRLRVDITDISGRLVRTLVKTDGGDGLHSLRFDGLDYDGRRLATGLYFYRIETADGMKTGQFVLLK
ncbi:MAG: PKD domain-containing protein [Candidatus Eisenbacteria bacterium]|uniref:PKD domain-containing protein n=1 Tax=Eiseniibacteriota bacterium TaxID=2212470 RepID=A0A538SWZ9_UNCEI|nr:MAG: PKD domain-containing protein [Candidatus Eisenbacteria bacterium]TMQ65556.1 MAG: PKD domain-containing protein [Candidatus Eisenbacteria bacterium]